MPLSKPGKPKEPVKNLRPIILMSILRQKSSNYHFNGTFEIIRKEIKIPRQHTVQNKLMQKS